MSKYIMNQYFFNIIGTMIVLEFIIYFTKITLYKFKNGLKLFDIQKSWQIFLRTFIIVLGLIFVSSNLQNILIIILITSILLLYKYISLLNNKYYKNKKILDSDYAFYEKDIRRTQYIWLGIALIIIILKIF